jgi:hypothetical protein
MLVLRTLVLVHETRRSSQQRRQSIVREVTHRKRVNALQNACKDARSKAQEIALQWEKCIEGELISTQNQYEFLV